jgi:ABC-type transport system involved in multi-copper enzyme maturation permease subunit
LGILTSILNQHLALTHPNISNYGVDTFINSISNVSTSLILGSICIHFCIGREFVNRTILTIIDSGYSRRTIFFSKSIVSIISCYAVIFSYPITASICATAINGWGENVEMLAVLKDVVLFVTINFSLLSFCFLTEIVFESKAVSLIINTIIVGIGSEMIAGLSKDIDALGKFLKITPLYDLNSISEKVIENSDFILMVLKSLSWGAIIIAIAYNFFKQMDIK